MLQILIACEYSGRVREAFRAKGHNAISCDLLESEDNSPYHRVEDWRIVYASQHWDMVIAFPPCTHICGSGSRWFAAKQADGRQQEGIEFFLEFTRLKCKWAIENPIGIMSQIYRKPDQIIHPWWFGHGEQKSTCLWLHGLPRLNGTDIVSGRVQRIFNLPPSPTRWKDRSRTYQGVADAMANQWPKSTECPFRLFPPLPLPPNPLPLSGQPPHPPKTRSAQPRASNHLFYDLQ